VRFLIIGTLSAILACRGSSPPAGESAAQPPNASVQSPVQHLRTNGTAFVRADGSRFEWRGISAFALLEQIAHGRSAEAEAYLAWAAGQRITVVRVLVMAQHLFRLSPADGRVALPRLLELAAARNLHVEIVALADTAGVPVEFEAHVKEVGAIAARHRNALVEIANEPAHPTQAVRLHKADTLKALASLVPEAVPVAFGSAEYGDEFAGGDYATYHFPRDTGDDGWGHVQGLASGAALVDRWRKPVVSDEPIGAAAKFQAGRRDDDPRRFAAAALMTRFVDLQPTFHYEGGLLAKQPAGKEQEAFAAWSAALDMFNRARVPNDGTFIAEGQVSSIADVRGARATFGRATDREVWLLIVDPGAAHSLIWKTPWRSDGEWLVPGARLMRATRHQ
jgi:hypothetical protein